MTHVQRHRFPWWGYSQALAVITLFAGAPLLGVFAANVLAVISGCKLVETDYASCLVFGMDWGVALFVLSLITRFTLITYPMATGALIVWVGIITIHSIAWRLMPKAH
jgi:hypothetical protein